MNTKLQNLMIKINNFLFENNEIGADRILHFVFAAWIVAECKLWGVSAMMIGFISIVTLFFLKEKLTSKF